jgi:glycosyltransferase involved in cell wall biosynthesis
MDRVSCLMITLPVAGRRARMLRAIDDYVRQTHADRELVVVVDRAHGGDPEACASAIAALGRDDIRVILPAGASTLGALRNVAVTSAAGHFVCQWDDDDRHHPDRIAAQAAAAHASGCAATILQDVLLLHDAGRSLRWASWARTPAGGHPATLFCRREAVPAYPEIGAAAALGEDLAVL